MLDISDLLPGSSGGSRTIRRTIPPPARPGQANSGACPAGRQGWELMDSARGRFHFWAVTQARELRAYYAARNIGYTVPRAAPFAGKALALAPDVTQGLGPPRAPTPAARVPDREGRTAAPRRALPRPVRSRLTCRLFYALHSMGVLQSRSGWRALKSTAFLRVGAAAGIMPDGDSIQPVASDPRLLDGLPSHRGGTGRPRHTPVRSRSASA